MRRVLIGSAIVIAAVAFLVIEGGATNGNAQGSYKIELDNAFGIVTGAQFKVAGVPAGTIKSIDLDQKTLHAVVTVQVTQGGFGSFHSDAFCQSRPQSLIGEYFVDCQPGHTGKVLPPGSTIPVTQTQSTIPADLLQNVMRMPYRERLSLIINELGAGVAARSEDLQTALQRAVPAITETDNLLNLLANDSHTIQQLNVNADAVITALANNSQQVQRFITEANNAATITASQSSNLQATLQRFPGFLEQLRPAMAKLGAAADANEPVLANLNQSAAQLNRFFADVVPFSHSALPALTSLGQASVTGKTAVQAAGPTVAHLNQFAKPTPELAQNLAIVLRDLDSRSRAVEKDPRSPNGQGFTGLEALLQYVFNQALAVNTFAPFGHQLAVDAFASTMCSAYATPQSVANGLKQFGPSYRQCYAWLGPNQVGINETDPSNPHACVPDPGGHPTYGPGPATSACKLAASAVPAAAADKTTSPSATTVAASPGGARGSASSSGAAPGAGSSGGGGGSSSSSGSAPAINLQKTIGQIAAAIGGGSTSSASGSGSANGGSSGGQAQQLLNYLLAP
jgi:phospholipid/cholesterol/gamma-HCH transport system substrate-binding protein